MAEGTAFRGASGGVPARGAGFSPRSPPLRGPLAPCFHPPRKHSTHGVCGEGETRGGRAGAEIWGKARSRCYQCFYCAPLPPGPPTRAGGIMCWQQSGLRARGCSRGIVRAPGGKSGPPGQNVSRGIPDALNSATPPPRPSPLFTLQKHFSQCWVESAMRTGEHDVRGNPDGMDVTDGSHGTPDEGTSAPGKLGKKWPGI